MTLSRKKVDMSKNAAKYHTVPCSGEAHSNPHIDNCMMCLNYSWGLIVVPVECATLEDWHNLSDAEREAHKRGRKAFAKKM